MQVRKYNWNTIFMKKCKNYALDYTDNNNIKVDFLAQNRLHLTEMGKPFLVNHLINFMNQYILRYEETYNDSDYCLSNACQEKCTDSKENNPVNFGNIQSKNSLYVLCKSEVDLGLPYH